jgi:tRNA G10  N-methylase Trm11
VFVSGLENDQEVASLLTLRSAEKVFILVAEVDFTTAEELFNKLQERISVWTSQQWDMALALWQKLLPLEQVSSNHLPIQFRVTTKIRGKTKLVEKTEFSHRTAETLEHRFKALSPSSTGEVLPHLVADIEDWKAEFYINMRKGHLWMGLALSKTALWKNRAYQGPALSMGKTSLKPSICYGMLTLLDQHEGVILEPMTGSGMIVLEMLDLGTFRGTCICGDNADVAVLKTTQNVTSVASMQRNKLCEVDVMKWDASHLPLRDNSVEGIITDLPFGKRIANEGSVTYNYPRLLEEFFRVLKKKGRVVLLTSHNQLLNRIINKDRRWINQSQVRINHGGIECVIFVLAKRYIPSGP